MIDLTRNISKEELNEMPMEAIPVPVEVIDETTPIEHIDEVCGRLKAANIVGFDTETKPSFAKGVINRVALIQLADREGAFVFRVCRMSPEALAPLRHLIEDKDVLKVGIGTHDDARELKSDYDWMPAGMVELRQLAAEKGITVGSLSKIYALLFDKRLTKSQRLSDWERGDLSEAQIRYAGLDAWAGFKIFETLSDAFLPSMIENKFESITRTSPQKQNGRGKHNPRMAKP